MPAPRGRRRSKATALPVAIGLRTRCGGETHAQDRSAASSAARNRSFWVAEPTVTRRNCGSPYEPTCRTITARGRRYPEHLYFALHLHAFIFIALGVSALSKFAQIPSVAVLGGLTALIWIPVYATLAFRRVYGSSVAGTIARARV